MWAMARRHSSEDLSEIQAIKLEAELIRFRQNENGVDTEYGVTASPAVTGQSGTPALL
jgi:hypothetical protein